MIHISKECLLLSNRELNEFEYSALGLNGRVHDTSDVTWGDRAGVLLVHGRAGNETLMWVFSKVIQHLDPVVFSPRALDPDPIGGYSWWNFDTRDEGVESPAPRATTLEHLDPGLTAISQAAESMVKLYGVNPAKITAIGFSQGAALVGSLALMDPGLFSKVALLAGFIPKSVQDHFATQEVLSPPAFFMSHGTKDRIIAFHKAEESRDFLISKGVPVAFQSDDIGHKISSGGMRAIREWLE